MIVIGIPEDEQACAIGAPGVEFFDAGFARIRQVVASLVAPIPLFGTLTIPIDPDEDRSTEGEENPHTGFVMIAVPRSPQAPHAVLVNDALRFPKRNGSTTRYLSEPEVAAAYRDRHAGQEYQSQRAVEIEREALARLDISDLPWIVVSLIPDLPGEFTISQASYRTFRRGIVNTPVAIG